MKKIISIFLIIGLFSTGYCAQSRILTWLGNTYKKFGLPTFTEYAWMVNLVNVFDQTATFVRTTNQLLKSYQKAYYEQKALIRKCQDTWNKCDRLFSQISPYDMDTWADALYRADNIVNWDCEDILNSLRIIDMNTFGACSTYVTNFGKKYKYDEALLHNEKTVSTVYTAADYDSLQLAYCNMYESYRNSTISSLRAELVSESAIFSNPKSTDTQKNTAKDRMAQLRKQIEEIEKSSSASNSYRNHMDTIIELTSNLISYNMTEMQIMEDQVLEFERTANYLIAKYNDLAENNVSADESAKVSDLNESVEFNDSTIFGTDADRVPAPTKPDPTISSNLKGKDVSNHDILNFQNAIAFASLRQEALLRDLNILKAKTMSMVTAQEAYYRELKEQRGMHLAHEAEMISVSLEAAK